MRLQQLKQVQHPKRSNGFTLIELMVVMAIIAVLATLIIGAISVARRTTRDTQRRNNMKTIQTALEGFYATYKEYPPQGTTMSSHGSLRGDPGATDIIELFTPNLNLKDPLATSTQPYLGRRRYCYIKTTNSTYKLRLLTEGIGGSATQFTSCIHDPITGIITIVPEGENFDLE